MAFEIGQIVEGKVTGIMNYGAFVDLGDGVSGMVHISEVANTYVKEIKDHLTVGQQVKVKILSTDENGRISLSIKKALPKPQGNNSNGGRSRSSSSNSGYHGEHMSANGSSSGRPENYDWSRKPNSSNNFDEMLSSFFASSDEKMAGMKKKQSDSGNSRPRNRKGNNNGGNQW